MILVFAGTTEGRQLAQRLSCAGKEALILVATEYGAQLLGEMAELSECVQVQPGRLEEADMEALFISKKPKLVVDATHPYAAVVTENIKKACQKTGCRYLRVLRQQETAEATAAAAGPEAPGRVVECSSLQDALRRLASTEGNVFLTTGSKEIREMTAFPGLAGRCTARVLPVEEAVRACQEAGIETENIIAARGPFGYRENREQMEQSGAQFMVTKESGRAGGFAEKVRAALDLGLTVVVIRRPRQESGVSVEDAWKEIENAEIEKQVNRKIMKQVAIVGIGMGNPELLTRQAWKRLGEAQVLIGARRMLEAAAELQKPGYEAIRSQDIAEYIEACPYDNIAVLLSGDIGFYSGAKKLWPLLQNHRVENYSGISAPVYLAGKLQVSWQDAQLVSLHNKQKGWLGQVARSRAVIALTGKVTAQQALAQLNEAGYGACRAAVGERLSYADEKIWQGRVEELAQREYDSLSVIYIENPQAENKLVAGLEDQAFVRGKVPMTKRDIRALVIARLRPAEGQIFWDVGAGTGSVTAEWAMNAPGGWAIAIEQKEEACQLIQKNKQQFRLDNIEIICGKAPEALKELPAPDAVFVGGSSGSLREIIQLVRSKNPAARIVATAVTLETLAEMQALGMELTQVSSSHSRTLGRYHMMEGENPVWIGEL